MMGFSLSSITFRILTL